jgi:ribosomal protein S9
LDGESFVLLEKWHGRPAREHAQDARATIKPIWGALVVITGDVQKVTVKMRVGGGGVAGQGAEVTSQKSKSGTHRRGRFWLQARK